jgi:NAD+ kinase
MPHNNPPPERIAVIGHPSLPGAIEEAAIVSAYLVDQGITTVHGSTYDETLRQRIRSCEFDMLITLGGDGTLLKTGHLAAPLDIPVLGINMGHFGFLYEVQRNNWRGVLSLLLKGDYWLEKRMMLRAELWHGDQVSGPWEVLNDVVVARGQVVRPVQLTAQVDGIMLASFVADGLITSTATGSTAYALAAGGPILPPELRNILIMPVAPHLSVDRAIVLPEGTSVSITVNTAHQAVMSVDGQPSILMADGDKVKVVASSYNLHFIRFQDPGYFYRNLTTYMEQNPLIGNSR